MKNHEHLLAKEQAIDFDAIFDEYVRQFGAAPFDYAHEMLADDLAPFPQELLREVPAATILVPAKLPTTNTEEILHTLRLIQRAAHQTGPLEILLWMNSRQIKNRSTVSYEAYEEETNQMAKIAEQAFHEIVTAITNESFDPNYVRIRPALDYPDPSDMMLNIRTKAMDCIGYDAFLRNFSYNHPVIWLDADMTTISKGAIAAIIARLKTDMEALLVRPNLFFTGEPDDTRLLREKKPSEKYAALFAIARKMFERNTGHTAEKSYVEECGLGMRIGDYFGMNGLRAWHEERESIGETTRLYNNAKYTGNDKVFAYEPGSRLGTSYRSLELSADIFPPDEDFSKILSSSTYETYSDRKEVVDRFKPAELPGITESTAYKLIGDLTATYATEPTERQKRILGMLIARLEFPPDEQEARPATLRPAPLRPYNRSSTRQR